MIVTKVSISRKKIVFVTIYRNPNQDSRQFALFLDRLQSTVSEIKNRKPHALI